MIQRRALGSESFHFSFDFIVVVKTFAIQMFFKCRKQVKITLREKENYSRRVIFTCFLDLKRTENMLIKNLPTKFCQQIPCLSN